MLRKKTYWEEEVKTRLQVTLLKRQGISGQALPEVPYNLTKKKKIEKSALSIYNTVTDFIDKLGI